MRVRLIFGLAMLTLGFSWFSFVSLHEGKTRESLETAPVALLFAGITIFVVRRDVRRLRAAVAAERRRPSLTGAASARYQPPSGPASKHSHDAPPSPAPGSQQGSSKSTSTSREPNRRNVS